MSRRSESHRPAFEKDRDSERDRERDRWDRRRYERELDRRFDESPGRTDRAREYEARDGGRDRVRDRRSDFNDSRPSYSKQMRRCFTVVCVCAAFLLIGSYSASAASDARMALHTPYVSGSGSAGQVSGSARRRSVSPPGRRPARNEERRGTRRYSRPGRDRERSRSRSPSSTSSRRRVSSRRPSPTHSTQILRRASPPISATYPPPPLSISSKRPKSPLEVGEHAAFSSSPTISTSGSSKPPSAREIAELHENKRKQLSASKPPEESRDVKRDVPLTTTSSSKDAPIPTGPRGQTQASLPPPASSNIPKGPKGYYEQRLAPVDDSNRSLPSTSKAYTARPLPLPAPTTQAPTSKGVDTGLGSSSTSVSAETAGHKDTWGVPASPSANRDASGGSAPSHKVENHCEASAPAMMPSDTRQGRASTPTSTSTYNRNNHWAESEDRRWGTTQSAAPNFAHEAVKDFWGSSPSNASWGNSAKDAWGENGRPSPLDESWPSKKLSPISSNNPTGSESTAPTSVSGPPRTAGTASLASSRRGTQDPGRRSSNPLFNTSQEPSPSALTSDSSQHKDKRPSERKSLCPEIDASVRFLA